MCAVTQNEGVVYCRDETCQFNGEEHPQQTVASRLRKRNRLRGRLDAYILSNIQLGSGSYSVVQLAVAESTTTHVAVKVVDKSRLTAHSLAVIAGEVAVLRQAKARGCKRSLQFVEAIDSKRYLYVVTEYYFGGDLYDYCEKVGAVVPENVARPVVKEVVLSLKELHDNNLCHLDVKLENVLYDSVGGKAIMCDFGFAQPTKLEKEGEEDVEILQSTFCGSVHYVAPEICTHTPFSGESADMWSLGVLLYTMLTGYGFPFVGNSSQDIYRAIVCQDMADVKYPPAMSEGLRQLISSLLNRTPWERPTAAEVLSHPWLQEM